VAFSPDGLPLDMKQIRRTLLIPTILFMILGSPVASAEISLGAFGSWGELKDSNGSIPNVKSSTVGGYLLPSVSLFPLVSFGAYGEYHRVGQLTEPSSASNYNKGFSGYLGGGAIVFHGGLFRLSGAYTFLGKGVLDKKTSLNLESTLEDPKGIHVILGLSLMPMIGLDLGYTSVKYNVLVNGTSTSQTRKWTDYRVGASLNF
jgi:hypothetical protein